MAAVASPTSPGNLVIDSAAGTPIKSDLEGAELSTPAKILPVKSTKKNAAVCTSDASVATEPDDLAPCEPGTSVVLDGIVWHESHSGVLVVNVTWRGRTYMGTLLDATRHAWAPPPGEDISEGVGLDTKRVTKQQLAQAITKSLPKKTALNGKKTTTMSNGNIKRVTQVELRRRQNEFSDGDSRTRRQRSGSSMSADETKRDSTPPNGAPRLTETPPSITASQSSTISATKRPVYIPCREKNCKKKFRNEDALLYHHTHAHSANWQSEGSSPPPTSLPLAASDQKEKYKIIKPSVKKKTKEGFGDNESGSRVTKLQKLCPKIAAPLASENALLTSSDAPMASADDLTPDTETPVSIALITGGAPSDSSNSTSVATILAAAESRESIPIVHLSPAEDPAADADRSEGKIPPPASPHPSEISATGLISAEQKEAAPSVDAPSDSTSGASAPSPALSAPSPPASVPPGAAQPPHIALLPAKPDAVQPALEGAEERTPPLGEPPVKVARPAALTPGKSSTDAAPSLRPAAAPHSSPSGSRTLKRKQQLTPDPRRSVEHVQPVTTSSAPPLLPHIPSPGDRMTGLLERGYFPMMPQTNGIPMDSFLAYMAAATSQPQLNPADMYMFGMPQPRHPWRPHPPS